MSILLQYGSSKAFLMLLAAAAGNYEELLARMPEDVVVFGHTHEFKNQKSSSKSKVLHYANSGTWTDIAKYVSSGFYETVCQIVLDIVAVRTLL